jgi:hypothetical protein
MTTIASAGAIAMQQDELVVLTALLRGQIGVRVIVIMVDRYSRTKAI